MFLIIYMNDKFYLLKGEDIIKYIETEKRKSIEFKYLETNGYVISESYLPRLKYLDVVDNVYFKE